VLSPVPRPQPQPERFGTPQTAPAVAQMQTAQASPATEPTVEALSFGVDQTKADAIGALILGQTKPSASQ